MLLFIFAVLALVLYRYRGYVKKVSDTVKSRGVEDIGIEQFRAKYPTYVRNTADQMNRFNAAYQSSFDFDHVGPSLIRELFSIRDDVLYNISEIRLRLPNDLDMEKDIARVYENTDRKLMEYITDVKGRFNINIYPGQTSSAFSSRHYRASNDVVT
jgi:hypothetical protein